MEATVGRAGVAAPTEAAPEEGHIELLGVPMFPVQHWVEAGDHVFRSEELGVVAGDPDLDAAVDKFAAKVEDLAGYLNTLDDATEDEHELLAAITERYVRLVRELEEREESRRKKFVDIQFGRRRRRARTWHRGTTPSNSSRLSPA
jgi:hypothetical protein